MAGELITGHIMTETTSLAQCGCGCFEDFEVSDFVRWHNDIIEESKQLSSSRPPRQYHIMINGSELTRVSPVQLHKLSMRLMKGTAQTSKGLPKPATEGNSSLEGPAGESQNHNTDSVIPHASRCLGKRVSNAYTVFILNASLKNNYNFNFCAIF